MADYSFQESIVEQSINRAHDELQRLRSLDKSCIFTAGDLLPPERPVTVITVLSSSPPTPAIPLADAERRANADAADADERNESTQAELKRLEVTVSELSETNDRIMAQNIALLADLEVAQRAVRELRGEKDALAVQLKRALGGQQ